MELMLNDILKLTDREIESSKIELNKTLGTGGRPLLWNWLCDTEEAKATGTAADCGFWSTYGNQSNFKPGQVVFSFVKLKKDDEWLLTSVAKIKTVNPDDWADIEVIDDYAELFGRLVIKREKPADRGRYAYNLKKHIYDAKVKAILPKMYNGEEIG